MSRCNASLFHILIRKKHKEQYVKKGQLSIEFLLIFAIFLTTILFFLPQFIKIKDKTEYQIQRILISKYSNDIENEVNSICILGEGNIRELEIHLPLNSKISVDKNILSISSGNISSSFTAKCAIAMYVGGLETKEHVLNKSAKIKIESKNEKILLHFITN